MERARRRQQQDVLAAHKDTYDAAIAGPLGELCEVLEPEFGHLHRFRPNRDVRFSADKRPYQEFASVSGISQQGRGACCTCS